MAEQASDQVAVPPLEQQGHKENLHEEGNASTTTTATAAATAAVIEKDEHTSQEDTAVRSSAIATSESHPQPTDTIANPGAKLPSPSLPSQSAEAGEPEGAESDGYYPQTLDVDTQDSDFDSSLGLSLQSSTVSTRSSLLESVEENGRTYHKYKQGTYLLPNDEFEQERLDLQHHLFKLTLDGKLNLAPVKNPQKVLDIGTGTGIWAVEYALQNPSAKVIGTDLSAIQPQFVPSNCQFEVDDAEDEWVFHDKFDYIHGRALFSAFRDPLAVFKKAYDALEPGGWLEMQEIYFKTHSIDGTHEGTAMQKWNQTLIEGAKKIGRDWWCTPNYERWFREAGFEDVRERRYQWPSNTWPKGKKNKTLGLWTLTNGLDGLSAVSMAIMTRVMGMSPEAVEMVLVDVRKDLKNKAIHAYNPIYVVYGRKPL